MGQLSIENFVDLLYRITGDEIYIVSFCGADNKDTDVNRDGLLSQWRGYGCGGGCALVFDTRKLEEMAQIEFKDFEYSTDGLLIDVVYKDYETLFKEELFNDITILVDVYKQIQLNSEPDGKDFSAFIKFISKLKHKYFIEENEVRMVALPTVVDKGYITKAVFNGYKLQAEKERKIRKIRGRDTPYIELFKSIDIDLPINKIIVGPHKEKDTRAAALRVMLRKTGIEIICSDIPYR